MTLLATMTAFHSTFGLVLVFGVIFPVVVQGLLLYIAAQAANERQANLDDLDNVSER